MKLSIVIKMALITASLYGASFAMHQNNMPTFSSEFCTDNAGRIHMLAAYLDNNDKNNLREVSTEIKQSIDQTIQNMVIHEVNAASLARISNTAGTLHSLKIRSVGFFINQHINFPLFPVLKKLDLSSMHPSVEQTKTIIDCCLQLEELNASNCYNATAGIIQALTANHNALQHLKKLDLDYTNISTGQMYTIIQCCSQLQELNVRGCDNAPAGIIQALTENPNALQHLTTLNLNDIAADSDIIFSAGQMYSIVQNCPHLEKLNVSGCDNAPAGIIQALTENPNALQHLTTLNLSWAYISDIDMNTIIQYYSQLQELDISYCYQANDISPNGVTHALTANSSVALRHLKKLNLNGHGRLSANQIHTIILHYPQLEELNLSGCKKAPAGIIQALKTDPFTLIHLKKLVLDRSDISADQINTIIQHCPQLQELNIAQCSNAPTGIIQALTVNPKALQYLKNLDLNLTWWILAGEMQTIIQHCQHLEELIAYDCNNAPTGIIQALTANPRALKRADSISKCI